MQTLMLVFSRGKKGKRKLYFCDSNDSGSHQVSNLFARDEMDEITQELIPVMKKEFPRRPPTNENLYDYFLSRTRHNLHVVLCFSPVRDPYMGIISFTWGTFGKGPIYGHNQVSLGGHLVWDPYMGIIRFHLGDIWFGIHIWA